MINITKKKLQAYLQERQWAVVPLTPLQMPLYICSAVRSQIVIQLHFSPKTPSPRPKKRDEKQLFPVVAPPALLTKDPTFLNGLLHFLHATCNASTSTPGQKNT